MRKKLALIMILFLFGCNTNRNKTIDVNENTREIAMGQENEGTRKESMEAIEDSEMISGKSHSNNEYYLLTLEGPVPSAILPNYYYVDSVGYGTLYYDTVNEQVYDSKVEELTVVVKSFNDHEVEKIIDVKEIIDDYDDSYFLGDIKAYTLIREDSRTYVCFYGYKKVGVTKIKPVLFAIDLHTEKMSIKDFYPFGTEKYRYVLGQLQITNFDIINDLKLPHIYGYNYYWDDTPYRYLCHMSIPVNDLSEHAKTKLYARFPSLEEDLDCVEEGTLTLYLDTSEKDLLSIFSDKDEYIYEPIVLKKEYTKDGRQSIDFSTVEKLYEYLNLYKLYQNERRDLF